jgi:hypothetical protein
MAPARDVRPGKEMQVVLMLFSFLFMLFPLRHKIKRGKYDHS